MAELADVQDLGSCAARRVGSTPTTRTRSEQALYCLLRLFYKSQSKLMLLPLSKSQPLRRAAIWQRRFTAFLLVRSIFFNPLFTIKAPRQMSRCFYSMPDADLSKPNTIIKQWQPILLNIKTGASGNAHAPAMAPPAGFEPVACRLGVWRFFWYDIPIITSHYF